MAPPRTFTQQPLQGPRGSTELYLVRHGASADAVEGEDFELVDGQGNPPLSPVGQEQAELVGARLATMAFDALYISSLRRTAETAAPFARLSGLVPVVDPDLREVFLGEWEGGTFRAKIADQDPLAVRMFAEQRWDVIPGAESAEAFAARLRRAVERIAAAHPDQRVVVVSHGAAIGEILAQASGADPFAFVGTDNASIARVIVAGDRWMVRGYNDVSHLAS